MANRTIVCAFLLLVPLLHAQDDSVGRPASNFASSGVGLTETLLKFAHQQNLRIAVEYVDRNSLDQPIEVNLRDNTVRQGLDEILRQGHGYSWQLRNGIIEITNRRASKRAADQFNKVIPLFEISENVPVKLVSALLWWNLQVALDPKLKEKGVGRDFLGKSSTVTPTTLHNRTVREILSYIVLNSDAEGWIVAGPPECLGFTPYCGLWYMMEGESSDPSYKTVLQSIRSNL